MNHMDVEVRHGWRYSALTKLTFIAANSIHSSDMEERSSIALMAMMELLWDSDEPPTATALINAGSDAVRRWARTEMHTRGLDKWGERAPRFNTYWLSDRDEYGDPMVERITDRLALAQVWEEMGPEQQETLWTRAMFDLQADAALAARVSPGMFSRRMRDARERAVALWHWPEYPPAITGRDRRIRTDDPAAIRQSRRRRLARAS